MNQITLRRKRKLHSYAALLVYEKPQGLYKYTARYVNSKQYLAYKNKTRCTLPGSKPFGAWRLTGNFNSDISASHIKDMVIERLNCMNARVSTLVPNQRKSFYNFLNTLKP